MNCRRCGNKINGLWNEWELCDKCGYRYHVGVQRSPGGDCQPIVQQTKAKVICCFCGSPCVRIRGESEWVKCSKCGELHRK